LSELRTKYSDFIMLAESVPCNWNKKGQVMRSLIQKTSAEKRQLIDGVRVLRDDSWVLVTPDRDKALFHIYAESRSSDRARALVSEFRQAIDAMQK
jgi:mannose-1-phosphate guanylyltransferase/phosphomannomutase